jgi:hypothetical protein
VNATRRPEWGVIVTQTCDLVEEGAKPKRPWMHVAPVYRLSRDRGDRRLIERERGFDYLCPVPGLDSDDDPLWVADLPLLIAVEKGWLVDAATADGFPDIVSRDRLAQLLARLFSRPAYPTWLSQKLIRSLAVLLEEITKAYVGDDPIAEVGLALGRSRDDPATAQVVFMLDGDCDVALEERIPAWGQERAQDAPEGINVLHPRIVSLDALTAREFRALDLVDISGYSPAEAPDPVGGSSAEGASEASA